MKNHLQQLLLGFLCLFFLCLPLTSQAHAPDQSYIFLRVYEDGIEARLEMEVEDLNAVLGLQLPKDISVESLQPYLPRIQAYMLERTGFASGGKDIEMEYKEVGILELDLGTFVDVTFRLKNVQEIPDYLVSRLL